MAGMNRAKAWKKQKKLLSKQRSNARRSAFKRFSKKLNSNLPQSEIWFRRLYKLYRSTHDRFNKPLNLKYIPDILNQEDKYIIEVDGSIHNTEEQIIKDKEKDQYYFNHGYDVIRVIAYSQSSFDNAMKQLEIIRQKHNPYYTHPRRLNIL